MAGPDIKVYLSGDASQFLAMITRATRSIDAFRLAAGAAIGVGGVQLGQLLTDAAGKAISFESAFTGVEKTVNGTAAELALLEQQLRDLATTELPISFEELAQIGEFGGQLGVQVSAIDEFTDTIARLGATTVLTTENAAISLARFLNIMELDVAEAAPRVGSALVELGNNAAVLEDELLEFSFRIGLVGNIVGLTADEVLAFGARLGETAVNVEAGGNAVSRAFLEMQSAVQTGGEDVEKFAAIAGLSVAQFSQLFRDDASAAMLEFLRGIELVDQAGGNVGATLESVGFNTIRLRQAILALAGDTDRLEELLDLSSADFANPTALTAESAKRFDDMRESIKLAVNQVSELAASLGEDLAPAAVVVISALGQVALFLDGIVDAGNGAVGILLASVAVSAVATGGYLVLGAAAGTAATQLRNLAVSAGLARTALVGFGAFAIIPAIFSIVEVVRRLGNEADQTADKAANMYRVLNDEGKVDPTSVDAVAKLFRDAAQAATDLTDAQRELQETGRDASSRGDLSNALTSGVTSLEQSAKKFLAAREAIKALNEEFDQLNDLDLGQLIQLRDLLAADDAEQYAEAIGILEGRIEDLVAAERSSAEAAELRRQALEDAGIATAEVTEETEKLGDALRSLLGDQLSAEEATLDFLDSLQSLVDQLSESDGEFDRLSQTGRDNRQAFLDVARAAVDAGAAYADATGSQAAGAEVTRRYIRQLLINAQAYGISAQQAVNLLTQLGLFPEQITTAINIDPSGAITGGDEVHRVLNSFPIAFDIPVRINLQVGAEIPTVGLDAAAQDALFRDLLNSANADIGTGGAVFQPGAGSSGGGGGGGAEVDEFEEMLNRLDLLFEFGDLSRDEYLASLEEHLAGQERLSDRWISVARRRNRVLDDIASEEERRLRDETRAAEQAQRTLERVIDQADRALREQVDDIEEQVAEMRAVLADAVTDAGDLVSLFGSELVVDQDTIVDALEHRIEATERWLDAMDDLRTAGNLPAGLLADLQAAGPAAVNLAEALAGGNGARVGGLLAEFDALAGRNVAAGLGAFNPEPFSLGRPGATFQGTTITVGPPQLTVQISAETLIGDEDAIEQLVSDKLRPVLVQFAEDVFQETLAGATG